MKNIILISTMSVLLSGCSVMSILPDWNGKSSEPVTSWTSATANIEQTDASKLHGWWKGFNDPILDQIVEHALNGSPDRKMAEARVLEARGARKSAIGGLLPQIQATGNGGRGDRSTGTTGNFYEAGFDASYELDIFGRNRNTYSAASSLFKSREAEYDDVSVTLVAEVARTYIEYRAAAKQVAIAQKNLDAQQKTLELVTKQKELGETPQLDVERAEGLVNTTKSAIPEFERQADNARLRLSILTGEMPEKIKAVLEASRDTVIASIKPALLTPAQIIAGRPDVRAAQYNLEAATSLRKAEIANLFPTITLGGFFGVAETALTSPASVWSASANAALSLLDFGRIQGRIDSAGAREKQAFENWRKTVISAVTDVETALSAYAHINEQLVTLQKAADNAQHSLELSQQLYKEGEISFLDVLDAERTLNSANSSVVRAEESQSLSLIALYKSLGVY